MPYSEYDPTTEAPDSGAPWPALLQQLGWETFIGVGSGHCSMHVSGWRRYKNDAYEYLAEIDDCGDGTVYIHTADFLEFTDLLARWAPIIQADAIAKFLSELGTDDDTFDVVGRIAAKARRSWDRHDFH